MRQGTIVFSAIGGGLALLIGVAMAVTISMAVIMNSDSSERIRISVGEVKYSPNVDRREAEALAQFLDKQFADLDNCMTFELDRRHDDLVVRMCARPQAWETDELDYSFVALEILLEQQVFQSQNVVFELCDRSMQTRKMIDRV